MLSIFFVNWCLPEGLVCTHAEVASPRPEGGRERPDCASPEFLFAGLKCFLLRRTERSSDARPATVTKVDSRRKLFFLHRGIGTETYRQREAKHPKF